MEWKTRMALRLKKTHKICAYLTILSGVLAVFFGIYFYRINPKHPSDVPLEWIHIGFYFLIFLVIEVRYRLSLQKNLKLGSQSPSNIGKTR